jgi:hypothetical protein
MLSQVIKLFNEFFNVVESKPDVVESKSDQHKLRSKVNPYLKDCVSLETTAQIFSNLVNDETKKKWVLEVYYKLYHFINSNMDPTFDEIDAMLLVCSELILYNMKDRLEEFILICPKKFIMAYANNSETIIDVLYECDRLGLRNIMLYLINNIHESKLKTLKERHSDSTFFNKALTDIAI